MLHEIKCRSALALGDFKNALNYSREADSLFRKETKEFRFLEAQALIELGDLKSAIGILSYLSNQSPGDPRILAALGEAYFRLGNYDSAKIVWLKTLALRSNSAAIRERLGDIAFNQSKFSEALTFFEDADRILPNQVSVKTKIMKVVCRESENDRCKVKIYEVLALETRDDKSRSLVAEGLESIAAYDLELRFLKHWATESSSEDIRNRFEVRSRSIASFRDPQGEEEKKSTSNKGIMLQTVVLKGETLGKISFRIFGTHKKWREIYLLNRKIIKDPNQIREGTVLEINEGVL